MEGRVVAQHGGGATLLPGTTLPRRARRWEKASRSSQPLHTGGGRAALDREHQQGAGEWGRNC